MKDFILYAGFWIRSMKYVIPESGVMFNVLADPLVKLIFYFTAVMSSWEVKRKFSMRFWYNKSRVLRLFSSQSAEEQALDGVGRLSLELQLIKVLGGQ